MKTCPSIATPEYKYVSYTIGAPKYTSHYYNHVVAYDTWGRNCFYLLVWRLLRTWTDRSLFSRRVLRKSWLVKVGPLGFLWSGLWSQPSFTFSYMLTLESSAAINANVQSHHSEYWVALWIHVSTQSQHPGCSPLATQTLNQTSSETKRSEVLMPHTYAHTCIYPSSGSIAWTSFWVHEGLTGETHDCINYFQNSND